ncbi:MAG: tyrosine--tRNA ligase [Lewinellaceae bacterium]|nr:tyrosine--tRNA ligase [Saprospiraceae bacterium]MCB9311670.1 tyrosine--tRNA ligase [Lewinellaceae bacterium]
MDFLRELEWRHMLQDATPGVEEYLASGPCVGYIGFDPTAPSLTIGNYVQLMLLTLFQRAGHTPIVLMGGATGRIGDPSGKDKERELKSFEELDRNLAHQENQMRKLIAFEGVPNPARLVNNHDFYRDMNVLEFLRTAGKTLTVNYMMAKESVKKRVETGISFTEFSYQILQAYDFQCLYEQQHCKLQMGGSDQWGNITSGTEFIRRNLGGKAYALTTPLLTKADGSKFGKSEEGNIWLDPEMTSPYAFYQFWINADDRDIPKFMRYFTLRSKEEVLQLEQDHATDPNTLKRLLAEEITSRVHSSEALSNAQNVSKLLFNPRVDSDFLHGMSQAEWKMVAREIPAYTLPYTLLDGQEIPIIDLLAEHTTILQSKGEARRAISGNAISVNKVKITSPEEGIRKDQLIQDTYLLLENGKKNKFLITFSSQSI